MQIRFSHSNSEKQNWNQSNLKRNQNPQAKLERILEIDLRCDDVTYHHYSAKPIIVANLSANTELGFSEQGRQYY